MTLSHELATLNGSPGSEEQLEATSVQLEKVLHKLTDEFKNRKVAEKERDRAVAARR